MSDIATHMAEVGFRQPPVAFEKNDPRGKEYGSFHAAPHPAESHITVVWHSGDGKRSYTMRMDMLSFITWAQEAT